MPENRPEPVSTPSRDLFDLGWRPFFSQQIDADEFGLFKICRVTAVHRSVLHVLGVDNEGTVPHFAADRGVDGGFATAGDWLLLDPQTLQPKRLLRRFSLIKRRAPGKRGGLQMIAANVDTLFIVTSCNQDFNIARLERYLTLAREANVTPVIVVTKSDLADEPDAFRRAADALLSGLDVVALNARLPEEVAQLAPWCGRGQTVAFVGSSGVGKSTLINTMTGAGRISTQAVREDDAKGRHTTSARQLHRLDSGGWLLDTPGMRELQLQDVQQGIEDVFADISELALSCRFRNCLHGTEPGCAVRAAVDRGELDATRFERWKKLAAEDALNTQSRGDRRAKSRNGARVVKTGKPELPE
ncbi:ribosome small subunit-dependent GTPase A [Pararhizobium gei]|uniref:ribosome small subunit-dependent GTPase A n=1 Tax=Pararhizobium gei TaxID=1395951 RepID=UPI0023DB0085|nr:ribosome small subunit-dependent GTPase A [Rhizobium gei]